LILNFGDSADCRDGNVLKFGEALCCPNLVSFNYSTCLNHKIMLYIGLLKNEIFHFKLPFLFDCCVYFLCLFNFHFCCKSTNTKIEQLYSIFQQPYCRLLIKYAKRISMSKKQKIQHRGVKNSHAWIHITVFNKRSCLCSCSA